MKEVAATACPRAGDRHREGYLAWFAKARRYDREDVKQIKCARCQLWTFPDERCELFEAGETR